MKTNEIIGYILLVLAAFASVRAVRTLFSGAFDYAGGDPDSFQEKLVARRNVEPGKYWGCWIVYVLMVVVFVIFGLRYLEWL